MSQTLSGTCSSSLLLMYKHVSSGQVKGFSFFFLFSPTSLLLCCWSVCLSSFSGGYKLRVLNIFLLISNLLNLDSTVWLLWLQVKSTRSIGGEKSIGSLAHLCFSLVSCVQLIEVILLLDRLRSRRLDGKHVGNDTAVSWLQDRLSTLRSGHKQGSSSGRSVRLFSARFKWVSALGK